MDERNVILEIRAGTGGDEASLFAVTCSACTSASPQGPAGKSRSSRPAKAASALQGIIAEMKGAARSPKLKFESGVHRVQRVPNTETPRPHPHLGRHGRGAAGGRRGRHQDQRERSQDRHHALRRRGGQHVNKTESAIRITHLPSGIAIVVQEERSQHRNRAKAMATLPCTALRCREAEARLGTRRGAPRQVGTGDRSERIRTYNFPQDA